MGRIHVNGQEVRGRTQARIVCALALNAGVPIRPDVLLEYCWTDDDRPKNGVQALSTPISRIRKFGLDGQALSNGPTGYLLDPARVDVDVLAFESLSYEAQHDWSAGHSQSALGRVERALATWRGEPCDAVSSFEWAVPHLYRLSERRLELVELRATIVLSEAGAPDSIVADLSDIARRYPDREATWCLLAEAQYRLGNQAEALRSINTLRTYLRDEIGVDLSPRTAELEARILAQDPRLRPALPSNRAAPIQNRVLADYRGAVDGFCRDVPSWFPDRLEFTSVRQQVSVSPPSVRSSLDADVPIEVDRDESGVAQRDEAKKSSRRLTLDAALRQYQRLVVVGDPGSGKSWALRGLALSALQGGGESESQSTHLPVICVAPLLEVALGKLDASNPTDAQIAQALVEAMPAAIRARLSEQARSDLMAHIGGSVPILLLIDGYDEIRADQPTLGKVLPFIESFCQRAESELVLTTRPAAVPSRRGVSMGWCTLEPFGNREQANFVSSWFSNNPPLARLLTAGIREHQLEAMRNPLMLSLFCSVAEAGQEPPRNENELWGRALALLASEEGRAGEIPRQSEKAELRLLTLQAISESFVQQEIHEFVSVSLIESRLEAEAIWKRLESLVRPKSVIDDLVATGIVRKSANGVQTEISFLHSSFRDYLIARSLAATDTWSDFASFIWSRPEWEPVFGFMAALLDDPAELLHSLVGHFSDDPLNIARLVAGRALAALGSEQVPEPLARRVRDELMIMLAAGDPWDRLRAAALLPLVRVDDTTSRLRALLHPSTPTRVITAAISALSGSLNEQVQLALYGVVDAEQFTVQEREAAVDAIADTGTDEALQRLLQIATDSAVPGGVRSAAALSAWRAFGVPEAAVNILSGSGSDAALQRLLTERLVAEEDHASYVAGLLRDGKLVIADSYARAVLLANDREQDRNAVLRPLLESLDQNPALSELQAVVEKIFPLLEQRPALASCLRMVAGRLPPRLRWSMVARLMSSDNEPAVAIWVDCIDAAEPQDAALLADFLAREMVSGPSAVRESIAEECIGLAIPPIVEYAVGRVKQQTAPSPASSSDTRSENPDPNDSARVNGDSQAPASLIEALKADLPADARYALLRVMRPQLAVSEDVWLRAVKLTHGVTAASSTRWIDAVPTVAPLVEARLLSAGGEAESLIELARLRAKWPGRAGEVAYSAQTLDARVLDAATEAAVSELDLSNASMLALASVGASFIENRRPSQTAILALFASGHATGRADDTWNQIRGFLDTLDPGSLEWTLLAAWLEAGYNLGAAGKRLRAFPAHLRVGNPEVAGLLVAADGAAGAPLSGVNSWSGCRRAQALVLAAKAYAPSSTVRDALEVAQSALEARARELVVNWPEPKLRSPAHVGREKWHWTLVTIAVKRLFAGDVATAIAVFEDVVAEDPLDPEVRNNLGFCRMTIDERAALEDLEAAARLFGRPFGVNSGNRMLANFRLENYERVLEIADELYVAGGSPDSGYLWDIDESTRLCQDVNVMLYVFELAERAAVLADRPRDLLLWQRRRATWSVERGGEDAG